MGKREEEFLREGDFFLKKEIPLSRSPSLKIRLGGEIGDWRIQLLRLFRGGKGTKRSVVGARLLCEGIRLSRGGISAAGLLLARSCLEPGFLAANGCCAVFLPDCFARGFAALVGLIGVLQVFRRLFYDFI